MEKFSTFANINEICGVVIMRDICFNGKNRFLSKQKSTNEQGKYEKNNENPKL